MPVKLVELKRADIIATVPPQSTRTYKAVSHGQIINSIMEELDKENFKVLGEYYKASCNNQIINGHLQLGGLGIDDELKFEVAFMNSYNKTKRATVVAGSEVRICENGHILGDSSYGLFKRKHMGTVSEDIGVFISEMVKSAADSFNFLKKQKDRMKEIEISKKIRNELIGQLYLEDAIIGDTQMTIIREEVQKPSFDYKADGTLWQTYNHITVGLKSSHPSKWMSNHQGLNKIVTEKFVLV